MWEAKFRLRHNCTSGTRIRKYKLSAYLFYLGGMQLKKEKISIGIFNLIGDTEIINQFYLDYKKDNNVLRSELNNNVLLAFEKDDNSPISKNKGEIFFTKPAFIDNEGFEYWDIFALKKSFIIKFISKIKPLCEIFELKSISKRKLDEVYFPHAIPHLTDKQRFCFDIALKQGYYETPKKTNILELAKLAKLAPSTYHEHLTKAENLLLKDISNMNLL
ncbi:MAG: helix-turn-helix domain-containing protein [archaeon]